VTTSNIPAVCRAVWVVVGPVGTVSCTKYVPADRLSKAVRTVGAVVVFLPSAPLALLPWERLIVRLPKPYRREEALCAGVMSVNLVP